MTLFQETSATGGKLWVGVYLAGVLRLPSGTNANASSLPIPMEPQNNHQNKTNQK